MVLEKLMKLNKNTHLTHLEDVLFHDQSGIEQVIHCIKNLTDILAGHTRKQNMLKMKVDGSPALVCGVDPSDQQFFVSTKGAFNKTPKLIKNESDLDLHFSENPNLKSKMAHAFHYLKTLDFDGVMQGDLMFTKNSMTVNSINNEKYITFQPNTLVYAVPFNSDTGKNIANSQIGIVWHTKYNGGTLADMTPDFNCVGPEGNQNVWSTSATFKDLSGNSLLSPKELGSIKRILQKISSITISTPISDEFRRNLELFINQRIREGKSQVNDIDKFIRHFFQFYKQKMNKIIDSLVKPDAKQRRYDKIREMEYFIETNYSEIKTLLTVYKLIVSVKNIMVKKLSSIEHDDIRTYDENFQPTDPEGFVYSDGNNVVKLVNRQNFSMKNFNKDK